MMRMRRLEDKATFSRDSVTYDVQLQNQSVASHLSANPELMEQSMMWGMPAERLEANGEEIHDS